MNNLIPISLVSLILVSAASGVWILYESRDGVEKNGGFPGIDPLVSINEEDHNIHLENDDPSSYDEDPYQDEDPDDPMPVENETGDDPIPVNNETGDDPIPAINETGDDPLVPGNNSSPTDMNDTEEQPSKNDTEPIQNNTSDIENITTPYIHDGVIQIEGTGSFHFDPVDVKTTRPDIFANGHFSLFDILVYLDHSGMIELEYHFDEGMDTFVIDSLNGTEYWWYWSHYSGGWQESNAWRMDLYPYKDNTTTMVYHEDEWFLDRIYEAFRNQVDRRAKNNEKIILPVVRIEGPSGNIEFFDVEVTAHGLRNDSFQEGVITAIDVIMSLGDQGLITYELKWYETISGAEPVKNYWVETINSDSAYGTCGFVYETGEEEMGGHNHIHIPSDQRVLVSPGYELFFWICL